MTLKSSASLIAAIKKFRSQGKRATVYGTVNDLLVYIFFAESITVQSDYCNSLKHMKIICEHYTLRPHQIN